MAPYILVFVFLSLMVLITPSLKMRHRYVAFFFGAGVILCFQAFRWRTGTDWTSYHDGFSDVLQNYQRKDFEIGYVLLNKIVRNFTDSFTIFLFVECGLNLFCIWVFAKRMQVRNPSLVLIYLFIIGLFPIRYTLASNLILTSYIYLFESRFKPFASTVILAFLIHRTTIAFLPVYFICRKNIPISILITIYVGCIVLGRLAETTLGYLKVFFMIFYDGADSTMQSKMDHYLKGEIEEYGVMSTGRYLLSIANSTLYVLFFYYFKNKYFKSDLKYNILFNLYILGISFNRLVMGVVPDLGRLTSLFTGGFIILIGLIISKLTPKWQLTLTIAILTYCFLSYYSSINGIYSDLFIPYYSIFSSSIRNTVY